MEWRALLHSTPDWESFPDNESPSGAGTSLLWKGCQILCFACILSRHLDLFVQMLFFLNCSFGLIKNIVSAIQHARSRSDLSRLVCFVLFNRCL